MRASSLPSASMAGLVLMVAGLVVLLRAGALVSPSPLVVATQAAAALIWIWARIAFGRRSFHAAANPTAGGLVTSGPYRVIRHPIYASAGLFAVAGALAHPSLVALGGVLLLAAGGAIRIAAEESLLRVRYPDYVAYAARTSRVIPFVL